MYLFLLGGGVGKMTIFGGYRFLWLFWGVTSDFDNNMGYFFFKINFCNLCSVMNIH